MATPTYGVITLDGLQYSEQVQLFTVEIPIDTGFQVLTNQRFSLPGTSPFLLKGLSRDIIYQGQSTARIRFRWRMANTQGTTYFFSGGLGMINDRVFDQLCFGTGQFPYPLVPPIPLQATNSIIYEVEDATGIVPYTIHLGLHGTYLFPADEATQ